MPAALSWTFTGFAGAELCGAMDGVLPQEDRMSAEDPAKPVKVRE